MSKQLENKSLLGSRNIEFTDQKITITTKHILAGSRQRSFGLDEITYHYEIRSVSNVERGCSAQLIVLAVIAFVILMTENLLMMLIIGGIFLFLFFIIPGLLMEERIIEIKTKHDPIWIYFNRKTKTETIEFVEALILASKQYFVRKYGYVDKDLPKERQFENYRWLLQNNIISEEKYEALKTALKEKLKEK